MILRGEGHVQPSTARIASTRSESAVERCAEESSALINSWIGRDSPTGKNVHIGTVLSWAEIGFAQFGFDLIALRCGTDETGRLSGWHGFGSAHLEEEVRTKVART